MHGTIHVCVGILHRQHFHRPFLWMPSRKHWQRLGWCGNSGYLGCFGNRAGLDFWPVTQLNLIRSPPASWPFIHPERRLNMGGSLTAYGDELLALYTAGVRPSSALSFGASFAKGFSPIASARNSHEEIDDERATAYLVPEANRIDLTVRGIHIPVFHLCSRRRKS
jgi:hypothetical protein